MHPDNNLTILIMDFDYEEKNVEEERTMIVIANFFLIFGIIATILCVFILCFPKPEPYFDPILKYYHSTSREFDVNGIAPTIGVLFSTLIVWSIMRVIAKISLNIKRIAEKKHLL